MRKPYLIYKMETRFTPISIGILACFLILNPLAIFSPKLHAEENEEENNGQTLTPTTLSTLKKAQKYTKSMNAFLQEEDVEITTKSSKTPLTDWKGKDLEIARRKLDKQEKEL